MVIVWYVFFHTSSYVPPDISKHMWAFYTGFLLQKQNLNINYYFYYNYILLHIISLAACFLFEINFTKL